MKPKTHQQCYAKLFGIGLLISISAFAEVDIDPLFSPGMVLQRDMAVPVWGKASPGESVTVMFQHQKIATRADTSGRWTITLEALYPSKPATLTVVGDNILAIDDVLVGEVWLGSGQSNMARPTEDFTTDDPTLKRWATQAQSLLRLYTDDGWKIADQSSISKFSALGYAFARTLQKKLDVPMGMIVSAKGNQPSGRWITPAMATVSPDPALQYYATETYNNLLIQQSRELEERSRAEHNAATKALQASIKPRPHLVPGDLWELQVSTLVPYAIRGVLWDQGEMGTGMKGVNQFSAMSALITGWRGAWNQRDLHFLHVQKPSGGGTAWDPESALNYKALPFALEPTKTPKLGNRLLGKRLDHIRITTIKDAPIVTSSDLGRGIHPPDKSSYGQRAARVALGSVYGWEIVTSGPRYKSHEIHDNTIRIFFEHTGKGLAYRHGDRLQGFEISGDDGKWVFAEAVIDGATVVVQNASVSRPKHARYAVFWPANYANLFNMDGLPALVFSTDRI